LSNQEYYLPECHQCKPQYLPVVPKQYFILMDHPTK